MLVLAVPVGAVLALFVHAHPDQHDTDHHEGRSIHAHVAGHAHPSQHVHADGPAIGHEDDDHDGAVLLDMFIAEAPAVSAIAGAIPDGIELPAPERLAAHALHVVHGHDPPALTSLPARAPPALTRL
jgi:hypothetical protein